jgi:hypothetical protein
MKFRIMKKLLFLLIGTIILISACSTEKYSLCPDNVTQVIDLASCPKEQPKCPICSTNETCRKASCSASTNYTCAYTDIQLCNGNGICEQGEFPNSVDCPKTCDDKNSCTGDSYDYALKDCKHDEISPCCGNNNCERGETYVNCQSDCEQTLSVKLDSYEKRQMLQGADKDLTRTDYTYLIVKFRIRNIGIDRQETIDYRNEKGFYYDPFKMSLEDGNRKIYSPEYDSDILDGWLDYTVLPKGETRSAALIFIVPLFTDHLRLVADDKYGSRLDIAEIY